MAHRKRDRLLAALIEKLPAPDGGWDRSQRVAWLQMMAMAFDVVYGHCAPIIIAPFEEPEKLRSLRDPVRPNSSALTADGASGNEAARRFYVDHDGFAMGDARPIGMEDLPEGATLWDERSGPECGDVSTILWRDIGTTRKSLPAGVTFKSSADHEQQEI